ncbi:hypothetical protein KAJ41_01255 [Candidatus Parcubacteria bacterium]|nr:hypothetical protein [Candidatus Parcubacteria bacterium]
MIEKSKILNSFIVGAIASVVFIVLITIVADLVPPLKDWLKDNFYHHWIGKGILASLIFLLTQSLMTIYSQRKSSKKNLIESLWILNLVSIFGVLVLFVFYVIETFLLH